MIPAFRAVPLILFLLTPLWGAPSTVRRIEDRFVAPCCWSESVAVHRSEVAAEMRAEIERMVAGGKTEDQIVDYYVARYGEKILLEPRGSVGRYLFWIPPLLILLATLGLLLYLRRKRRIEPPPPPSPPLPALMDLDID